MSAVSPIEYPNQCCQHHTSAERIPEIPHKSGSLFGERLREAAAGGIFGDDLYAGLVKFERQILAGKQLSARELLICQLRAQHFNLRTEMLSKVADALVSTTRRLQQS